MATVERFGELEGAGCLEQGSWFGSSRVRGDCSISSSSKSISRRGAGAQRMTEKKLLTLDLVGLASASQRPCGRKGF